MLVLVFDLDQTLVDSTTIFKMLSTTGRIDSNELYNHLNIRLLEEVLKPAVELKGSTVSAILLLSNNSLDDYVKFVCDSINRILGTLVFDLIVTRNGTDAVPRAEPKENPPKRLKDVETMLRSIGNTSDLNQVYFFDDLHHAIEKELEPDHYCLIHNWTTQDSLNDYGPVKRAMSEFSQNKTIKRKNASLNLKGGTRKKRARRKNILR